MFAEPDLAFTLSVPARPGRAPELLGRLTVAADGTVRAAAVEEGLQPYLSHITARLNAQERLDLSVVIQAAGRFAARRRAIRREDPEYAVALQLTMESDFGLIVEAA